MSSDAKEQTVQSILPFLHEYFTGLARSSIDPSINHVEFISTATKERRGVSGSVLISDVVYSARNEMRTKTIALKFFNDKSSALNELKNAMELVIKFKSVPEFGIPDVIFASTESPILIIYEGVTGTNYDELNIPKKAREAGRLLATIHGAQIRPVNTDLYLNLIRMMGTHLAPTGKEKEIANSLRYHYDKLQGAKSGCDPFSDFHQSNVMISHVGEEIMKAYVIDPEFMQKGSFDRLEDVGVFFGMQLLEEYRSNNSLNDGLKSINEFFRGYNSKMKELGSISLSEIYPRGCPLSFFIAQWALMDSLDIAINRGGDLSSPEVTLRIDFALFVLNNDQIRFPNS